MLIDEKQVMGGDVFGDPSLSSILAMVARINGNDTK